MRQAPVERTNLAQDQEEDRKRPQAQGTAKKDEKQVNGAFYHVHWYKYPLTYWLNIITAA